MNMSAIKTAIHDSYIEYEDEGMDKLHYDAYVDECEARRQAEINRREAALWLSQADVDIPF